MLNPRLILLPLLAVFAFPVAAAEKMPAHLSRFAAGDGPVATNGVLRLLDAAMTPLQSNAVAFDRSQKGAFETVTLEAKLRVLKGGDGGAFLFLATSAFGARGPAPFVPQWTEPNLKGAFAVGIDVHNPPNEEPFGPWGNYQSLPEREISLHWDGREIVKRVAPKEFRGDWAEVGIALHHVVGGAEVTVSLAGEEVYDRYFIAHLMPYESRLAIGAGTRADATTAFDVKDVSFAAETPAAPRRRPLSVEVFHHVMTNNQKTSYDAEVALPPAGWAFGRVILTLDIHDGGKMWDEWDRNGNVSVQDAEGNWRVIVPFITSYRTPCHWKVDVTHFRPLLTGKTKFRIAAGTNFYKGRGYLMSVRLDFHHGTPALAPSAVVPLWDGVAKYRSAENHFRDFFTPREVAIPAETKAARVFTTTTGHSQIGEFTPSERTMVFAPVKGGPVEAERRFANTLWKTDCYLNPNRPQFGTWKYSRAGWAPGDVVRPWWIDVTPHMKPGETAGFRYEPKPYDFGEGENRPADKQINAASHVVRSYLILYREPGTLVPAPVLLITNVAKGSNAAKVGLKAGDYLASYGGRRLDSVADLRAAIQSWLAEGGKDAPIEIYRGSERMEFSIPPGKLGVNLSDR